MLKRAPQKEVPPVCLQTTKRALAASLEKLLAKKPLDKITVIDIVEDCEVNRQTFIITSATFTICWNGRC